MGIETPNGYEFSAAGKLYLCADRFIRPGTMLNGYPAPSGAKVNRNELADAVVLVTLDWLDANHYAQLWQDQVRALLGSRTVLRVRALYSDAPGFTGRFLQATSWKDADLIELLGRLMPYDKAPAIPFLDGVSQEFVEAGILTRGGYGAHGNVWNAEWLDYLVDAWSPEVYDALNRAMARPDRAIAENNLGVAFQLSIPRDDDIDD